MTPSFLSLICSNSVEFASQSLPPLVLVTDDDKFMRALLRQVMEKEGYRVAEAQNGHQCLELYAELQPDLVLLDAKMPVVDGFGCCKALNQTYGQSVAPILIITSLDDSQSVDCAFEAGATDYITKPIHWPVLRQRVQRLLKQATTQRELHQFRLSLQTLVDERTVELSDRTRQLQRTLEFAATLKEITDKVRDSLDEQQILQTAVQQIAWALEVGCCNAALYDLDRGVSNICIEYSASIPGYQGRLVKMSDFPEIYHPLQQGKELQFCSLLSPAEQGRVSLFACPIRNADQVIGDLWLMSPEDRVLDERERYLVQQIASQCAIAIRQAQLYQVAQAQVQELKKLNQLKDDFLSTVSHELRSPLSNMRLAIHGLERLIEKNQDQAESAVTGQKAKTRAYLNILHNECEREIGLVNDLLDLQRLEAGRYLIDSKPIPYDWIVPITDSFREQLQRRQQYLEVELPPTTLRPLVSDLNCLERILQELLTNACKYSPSGAKIVVSFSTQADQFVLKVSNFGVELATEQSHRIFDKFYRIPNGDPWKQGGTGLGLALVKRLVENIGSSIRVTSGANQTCFTIELKSLAIARSY